MNLLVISQYFYPEQFRVSDVCFRLAAMGHDITVLTGLPNYPAGEIFDGYQWDRLKCATSKSADLNGTFDPTLGTYIEEINGVKVIRCNLYPRKKGNKNLARNYFSFAYHASKVARTMARDNQYDFDKIIVFQYSPVTMAIPAIVFKKNLMKRLGKQTPLYFYSFDLWPESIVSAGLSNHGIIYEAILKLSKWIYKKADTILISSKNFEKYFNSKLKIYGNIHYLPIYAEDLFIQSLVDEEMQPSVAVQAIHVTDCSDIVSECTNLVFAGNIGEMQSMDTIIKAANLVKNQKDIHFHIVGDGSALDKSMQLAKDLALDNITFHGRHPLEDMPKYYAMADAFLVTLKKDEFISYTLPGKIQSYMASGKPIIAAIDGEASDVIRNANCGLCCNAEDYEGLAKIIIQFNEEKENRQKYGDCSKAYYNANFSEETFMASLSKLITSI